jgi:hypothetical protein
VVVVGAVVVVGGAVVVVVVAAVVLAIGTSVVDGPELAASVPSPDHGRIATRPTTARTATRTTSRAIGRERRPWTAVGSCASPLTEPRLRGGTPPLRA